MTATGTGMSAEPETNPETEPVVEPPAAPQAHSQAAEPPAETPPVVPPQPPELSSPVPPVPVNPPETSEAPAEGPAEAPAEPSTTVSQPPVAAPVSPPVAPPVNTVLAPANRDEFNRTNLDFRRPMPRPKVRGRVIDIHTHLLAARHAQSFFEAADHYGIHTVVTMSPLEEALGIQRDWAGRVHFIAVPRWGETNIDDWLRRLDAFYNMGSRIIKFHMAPGTMIRTGLRLDSPQIRLIIKHAVDRDMILMSHVGDPDTWYANQYKDSAKFGTREEHYRIWEDVLREYRDRPWLGAHLGGNPEDLGRLQHLLDTYPNLYLDCSATRWMVREISSQRDAARDFFIRNQDRLVFGTDQVSGDDRDFDFCASRIWCHRKLWETAYQGPSPIIDPDLARDNQPVLRGLALPDEVLQKLYHDNAVSLLARVGVRLDPAEWRGIHGA